jgi:transposase-like protein
MAERRTRRSFTREFKAPAVKRLLDGGKGLSPLAVDEIDRGHGGVRRSGCSRWSCH